MSEAREPVVLRFRGPVDEARTAAARAAGSGMTVTWAEGDDGFAAFTAVVVDGAAWADAVELVESLTRPVRRLCAAGRRRTSTSRCTGGALRRA